MYIDASLTHTGNTVCDSEPCLNGGGCISLAEGLYRCECLPGFTGGTCRGWLRNTYLLLRECIVVCISSSLSLYQ